MILIYDMHEVCTKITPPSHTHTHTHVHSSIVTQLVMKYAFQGNKQEADSNPTIDYQTLSQAHANITAGCCMALGLRFAGTCDHGAFKCLVGVDSDSHVTIT